LMFFFSSRRRHTSSKRDWSSDVCSSDLLHLLASSYRLIFYTFYTNEDMQYHSNLIFHLIFRQKVQLTYLDYAVLKFLQFQAYTVTPSNTPSTHSFTYAS